MGQVCAGVAVGWKLREEGAQHGHLAADGTVGQSRGLKLVTPYCDLVPANTDQSFRLIAFEADKRQELAKVAVVIAARNPDAAVRVRRKIRTAVQRLVDFPESGRVGQVSGTRELIISKFPYIVVYRVEGDLVEILRVLHTTMDTHHGGMQ